MTEMHRPITLQPFALGWVLVYISLNYLSRVFHRHHFRQNSDLAVDNLAYRLKGVPLLLFNELADDLKNEVFCDSDMVYT